MDKIKTVKIKNEDGSVSKESYYISANANCIDMTNGYNVQETIGNIDVENDDSIAEQLKKKPYYFDTIADMKNANLKAGDLIVTLGYYSINDGGGAEYKVILKNENLIDEQFYILLSNNLMAQLIYTKPLDVRKIGFNSNGILIDDKIKNGLLKEKSFIFKNGVYRFNPISISNFDQYILYGDNADLILESSFKFIDCQNISIQKMNFKNSSANMFEFKDCQNVIIENNNFLNSTKIPIKMVRTNGKMCKNFKILNNNFISVSKTDVWGGAIYVDGQGKINPEETSRLTLPIEDIIVQGNLFEDVGTGGVNFGGVKNAIVDNNIFKNAYGSQNMLATFTRESTELIISNNTFSGCGYECCILNYCTKATITGNFFQDYAYGITIEQQSHHININGNTFNGQYQNRTYSHNINPNYNANTYGVLIATNSTFINIDNNNMQQCTYGLLLGGGIEEISFDNNTIENCTNGVGTDRLLERGHLSFINNHIHNVNDGLVIGSYGVIDIYSNFITANNHAVIFTAIIDTTVVNIKNNTFMGNYIFNVKNIANYSTSKLNIVNNEMQWVTNIFNKIQDNAKFGSVYWNNPNIIVSNIDMIMININNSVIYYEKDNFTNPLSENYNTPIGYYLGDAEDGTVYVMSNHKWRRKTGGGGSTIITYDEI